MADTETMVKITPRMQDVIRHMLTNPKARYCISEISNRKGIPSGTLSPIMRTMEGAGWIEGETEPRGSHAPRRWYRFTTGSASMLRRAIAN